jgi:hypothetical protein
MAWSLIMTVATTQQDRGPCPSAALGIGRHMSGIDDPFNGHIDEFRIAHTQRSDGWIETTYNNMSNPAAFALAGSEEQEGGDGEPPPLADAGVVVCLMA